jgi:lipopolysaccharide biosynthesis glycosyltransferase
MKGTIRIVMASDNNYAILIGALLKSIEMNHTSGEPLEFYIISDGIRQSNIHKINDTIDPTISHITWLSKEDVVPKHITLPHDTTGFPLTAYLRVFAAYAVPPDVEKVIYLDVDMIVKTDISKLWHTDIGNHIIGAVRDHAQIVGCDWGGIPNWKELGMKKEGGYFNSGLLIINLRRWMEEDIVSKFITCMEVNKKSANLVDQYGLNVVLHEQWYELDKRWNSFSVTELPDPFIIHFLDIKPIFTSYKSSEKYKQEFFYYLAQTPWRNFKPISGKYRLLAKARNKVKKRLSRIFSF